MCARLYLVLSTRQCLRCRLARLSPVLGGGLLAQRRHLSPPYLQRPAPTLGVRDSVRMHKRLKAVFKPSGTKRSWSPVTPVGMMLFTGYFPSEDRIFSFHKLITRCNLPPEYLLGNWPIPAD